jgi:hypothetical protein
MTRLSISETRRLAEDVAALLDRIRTGDLVASTAMTYRLEGALTAVEAVLGNRWSLIADLAEHDSSADNVL